MCWRRIGESSRSCFRGFLLRGGWIVNPKRTTLGGLVVVGDTRVYFVAETKGHDRFEDLPLPEQRKIRCGRKHFDELDDVAFVAPVATVAQALEEIR